MSKPFDAATKHLIEAFPEDWLVYAGLPTEGKISVVDADLATISLSADKVIKVEGPKPYIAHIEFQSGLEPDLDERILGYNIPIRRRHRLRVRSAVILLRPEASSPSITGRVHDVDDDGNWLDFGYKLIKTWEQPVEAVLAGGLGTLPLAPVSNVAGANLADVVRRMEERLSTQPPSKAAELETAAFILMGLRFSEEMISQLLRGVRQMEESVTYQAIIKKGQARGETIGMAHGERKLLIMAATKKLGAPGESTLAALSSISDVTKLERMFVGLDSVNSWEQLLEL